jgi:hypothetical protein
MRERRLVVAIAGSGIVFGFGCRSVAVDVVDCERHV